MSTEDAEELAEDVRARVAAAALGVDEIQGLADRAIDQIRTLADEAVAKARQVEVLVQRLAELMENDDAQP